MAQKKIRSHMEVVGADDEHVGIVDSVDEEHIRLTRTDEGAGGEHHLIPLDWVETVDAKVHLNVDADEAMDEWETVE